MNDRQTAILVDPETAEALQTRARALGLSLDVFLRQLAGTGAGDSAQLSGEEFEKALDEFFLRNPRRLPPLPPGFSRADIYSDHD
jgi:hypothetical protein